MLCVKTLTEQDATTLKKLVDGEYLANWLIDNLPVPAACAAGCAAVAGINAVV